MADFRFKIGDVVMAKVAVADCINAAKIGEVRLPNFLIVAGRTMEECSGGVQIHYACSREGGSIRMHECELIAEAEWDAAAHDKALMEAQDRRDERAAEQYARRKAKATT